MNALRPLDRADCLALLASRSLGRVAFSENALPAIRPVGYALVGTHVVVRTDAHDLARRLDGQVVAFGIDDIDVVTGTGWSVVMVGPARLLERPGELIRRENGVRAAFDEAVISIGPGQLTGSSDSSGGHLGTGRHPPHDPGAGPGLRVQIELAAELRGTRRQVGQPAAPTTLAQADTVIGDLEDDQLIAYDDDDLDCCRVRMPCGVAQRLAQSGQQVLGDRGRHQRVEQSVHAQGRREAELLRTGVDGLQE